MVKTLAAVPPGVPMLPESTVARPDVIGALKASVLKIGAEGANTATVTAPVMKPGAKMQASGMQNTTAAAGMGGVGKTMMAAALVRDEEVLAAFEKICWVSVGQEPNMPALLNTLHIQLTSKPLPEDAKARAHWAVRPAGGWTSHSGRFLTIWNSWVDG